MRATFGPAAADPAGWTRVDWSAGTTVNPTKLGASTSWGPSSRVDAAALHGRFDSGLDAGHRRLDLAVPPSATGLLLRMTCTTPPSSAPNAGALVHGALTQATLATNEGQLGGLRVTAAGAIQALGTFRPGDVSSAGASLTGACVVEQYIPLVDDKLRGIMSAHTGATGNDCSASTVAATTAHAGSVYLVLGVEQNGASPGSEITWQDVTTDYQFV